MKLQIELEGRDTFRGFRNGPNIYLRFTYCNYEQFYAWLEKNSPRMQSMCQKYGWTYDVGHGDMGIKFSK